VATNVGAREVKRKVYSPGIPVERGAELGVFEMGSTVIVVTERLAQIGPFSEGEKVKLGRALGVVA
jgi:hypothetical protein